ncbi:MAG: hypothetical protein ACE5I3_12910 [Phycisphaerae bacterium]
MNVHSLNEIVAAHTQRSATEVVAWLEHRLKSEPRCPVTRYLLACHCFDRRRCAQAVQHMMTAHHAEPAFESAALLVFAGLNWASQRKAACLPVLLDTWEEFRRPEFDRHRKERRLLDAFAKPREELNGVSPLARRLWRLPIRTLRAQIREAVLSPNAGQYPLLLAPA